MAGPVGDYDQPSTTGDGSRRGALPRTADTDMADGS